MDCRLPRIPLYYRFGIDEAQERKSELASATGFYLSPDDGLFGAPGGCDAAEKSRKASTPLNYRRMIGATGGGYI
jgi:hypothetical protein